jgi:NADPH-dependent 2,4-dienoyl-CoA reductase/sulfur reductase-like enzyme
MQREMNYADVVVIGGGPAGLAAAASAARAGADVTLIERDGMTGGILNQCIHDGFGVHRFGEVLAGPEYAQRYIDEVASLPVRVLTETFVLSLSSDRVLEISHKGSYSLLQAGSVVLAMGCRERTAGAISLPGTRPSGIYTAGTVQNLINLQNKIPGRRAVILGSGDIGLIMARRIRLEGGTVEGCYEILPYASGLSRNIRQCLDDFFIPLHLSATVIETRGKDRLDSVVVAQIDADRVPVPGTERIVPCDLLLLSVGLIPENELTSMAGIDLSSVTGGAVVDDFFMTSCCGIFACGNALHVHDLVDFVSEEAALAGSSAAQWSLGVKERNETVPVSAADGVRYVLPQKVTRGRDLTLSLRVTAPSKNRSIVVRDAGREIARKRLVKLHPAEMIRINVPSSRTSELSSVEVSVE